MTTDSSSSSTTQVALRPAPDDNAETAIVESTTTTLDDLRGVMHQNVCSGYDWDDIAEDYVDEAGRACLQAIVSSSNPPPTLALHEVTVDTVGIVGLRVQRAMCRDVSHLPASPAAPSDMRLVVSFLRNGQAFATTRLSQPLKDCTKEQLHQQQNGSGDNNDDPTAISDLSSLDASFVDLANTTVATSITQHVENARRLVLAKWGKTWRGKREAVTFDSCLEVSPNGEETSDIDVVVYLVDTRYHHQNEGEGADNNNNNTTSFASVPLAIGSLRIQGNGGKKCMVCDIPLHEPFPGQSLPALDLASPVGILSQFQQGVLDEDDELSPRQLDALQVEHQPLVTTPSSSASMPNKKKKKTRGLAKLFRSRSKKIHQHQALPQDDDNHAHHEEKKHDDDDDETYSFSLCNPPPSFINDAYTLDQVEGAFLRFNVEWKEKEINFEVNLNDTLQATTTTATTTVSSSTDPMIKENSMQETTTQSHEDPTTIHEEPSIVRPSDEPLQPLEHLKKLPFVAAANEKEGSLGKPPLKPNAKSAASLTASTAPSAKQKRNKSMSFFFKKKKTEDKRTVVTLPEPPTVRVNSGQGRGVFSKQQPEEDEPCREPDQEAKKAAMLIELREGSTPIPDHTDEEVEPSPDDILGDDADDETTQSILDSMFKAMVGQSKAEVVLKEDDGGAENAATTTTSTTTTARESARDVENDDETANSIFDSVYKAMIGQSKTEIVATQKEDVEIISSENQSQTSQNTSRAGKKVGDIVSTGSAYCHVLPSPSPRQLSDEAPGAEKLDESDKQEETDPAEQTATPDHEDESAVGFELTSDSGLYAQFVQATSSLLRRVDGYPHVELKELEVSAQLNHEPTPALECSLSTESASKESDVTKSADREQVHRVSSGPVDIDALDDGEVAHNSEDESFPRGGPMLRSVTPSPAELSMERMLSWDERQLEGRKTPRFGLGRRSNRGGSGGESIKSAPAPRSGNKKKQVNKTSLALQVDSDKKKGPQVSTEANEKEIQNETAGEGTRRRPPRMPTYSQPLSRTTSLKAPSSLPRHSRETSKLSKNDRSARKAAEGPPSPSKSTNRKRRHLWGKLFRSKSSSSIIDNPPDSDESKSLGGPVPRSSASVVSDAETVEMDNMAKASVIEALGGRAISPSQVPVERNVSECKSVDSAFVSQQDEELQPVPPKSFSLFDLFGKTDEAGCGPVHVDGKEAWLYARDDDTLMTKDSQYTKSDDLTLIPSPTDVLLSETYHRCGPAKIADLGDAVLEEARQFFRDKSDSGTLATYTFDDPTYDPSILSADAKSASVASGTGSVRSTPSKSIKQSGNGTLSIGASPSLDKYSPKGVAEFDRYGDQTKVESLSEAFVNFITCRPSGRSPVDGTVPSEFIRRSDTDSLGDDLTLTTYEMQVEIEQYKKKIEQVRHQAECLDENGDAVGKEEASLVFESPNMGGQRSRDNPF